MSDTDGGHVHQLQPRDHSRSLRVYRDSPHRDRIFSLGAEEAGEIDGRGDNNQGADQ